MRSKNPVLVTFIGDLNVFFALSKIASFAPTPKFLQQLGVSFIPIHGTSEGIISIIEVLSLLIITYGFLRLKKWGYWLVIAYNLYFLVVSIVSILSHNNQYAPFFIPSILMLSITFQSKRYFIEKNQPS